MQYVGRARRGDELVKTVKVADEFSEGDLLRRLRRHRRVAHGTLQVVRVELHSVLELHREVGRRLDPRSLRTRLKDGKSVLAGRRRLFVRFGDAPSAFERRAKDLARVGREVVHDCTEGHAHSEDLGGCQTSTDVHGLGEDLERLRS